LNPKNVFPTYFHLKTPDKYYYHVNKIISQSKTLINQFKKQNEKKFFLNPNPPFQAI
jgi:hypothetical protein